MSKESKEDYLSVDQPIPGQNYVCLSFVSPEKNILQKQLYEFYKFNLKLINDDKLLEQFKLNTNLDNFKDLYENYIVGNKDVIDKEYNEMTDFQTSVRGVKVRGTYESEKEAKVRAEVLRRRCPNDNVFIGQVGYWLPWDPNPLDIKNLEYQETELNILMKKYNENMEHREHMFEEEKRTQIEKARKENVNSLDDTSDEISNNDDTQKKFSEFREILNDKDNLMNSSDPWMQRKEEETKNNKEETKNNKDEVVQQESVLKDEDVQQEITINYGENSNTDNNPEPEE